MRARFAQYYQACYPQVLAFCMRRAPADAAEDLTAETFTRAWRNYASLADEANPLPWFYGIARNVVGEFYRSRQRHPESTGDDVDAAIPPVTDSIDLSVDINRALKKLPTDDQELLMLSAWEDLNPKDIAEVLGISPNTARVRIHRARARLAQALEGVQL